MKISELPAERVRACINAPVRADGTFVLYWMTAARRTTWCFAAQHAAGSAAACRARGRSTTRTLSLFQSRLAEKRVRRSLSEDLPSFEDWRNRLAPGSLTSDRAV
jgi:hypothetical protein